MAFGFGQLRLSPEAFWRMTPRELAAATHDHRAVGKDMQAACAGVGRHRDRQEGGRRGDHHTGAGGERVHAMDSQWFRMRLP